MYSPDTMNRLNEEAVVAALAKIQVEDQQCAACMGSGSIEAQDTSLIMNCLDCEGTGIVKVVAKDATKCDYCDEVATVAIPIYNPADAVREPPVEGAYGMINVCQEHYDEGSYTEEAFYCGGCGELFITHHSWDSLVVTIDDEQYCQECALEQIELRPIADIVMELQAAEAGTIRLSNWYHINNAPGYDEIWAGEYCAAPDFPGYQSLDDVADDIEKACEEAHVTEVLTFVTHNYQFSVVLGVFAKTAEVAAEAATAEAEVAAEGGSDVVGDK